MNMFFTDRSLISLIKKLSYESADEWIQKLLEIPWGIPKEKWIEYKFDIESDISGIVEQEIAL